MKKGGGVAFWKGLKQDEGPFLSWPSLPSAEDVLPDTGTARSPAPLVLRPGPQSRCSFWKWLRPVNAPISSL